jgi:hypothetical protein
MIGNRNFLVAHHYTQELPSLKLKDFVNVTPIVPQNENQDPDSVRYCVIELCLDMPGREEIVQESKKCFIKQTGCTRYKREYAENPGWG